MAENSNKNRFWFMCMLAVTLFGLVFRLEGFELRDATPDHYRLVEDSLLRWEGYGPFFRDGYGSFTGLLWSIGFAISILLNNLSDLLDASGAQNVLGIVQQDIINLFTYSHLYTWIPRLINILLASMLVPATYVLAKEMLDSRPAAALASILTAMSPLLLHLAESLNSDSVQALCLTLSLAAVLKSVRKECYTMATVSGILGGLALACKAIAVAYWLPMAITATIMFGRRAETKRASRKFFALHFMGAGFAYLLTCPYIVSDFQLYLKSFYYRSHQFLGLAGFSTGDSGPWAVFVKYPFYSLDMVAMLACVVGFVLIIRKKQVRNRLWPLFAAIGFYLALMLSSKNVVSRYYISVAPILVSFAAYAAVEGVKYIRQHLASKERLAATLSVLLIVAILPWDGAIRVRRMLNITDSRILARDWIEANVPPHATIVVGICGPKLTRSKRNIERYHKTYEERITSGRLKGLGTELFADAVLSEEKHFYKVFSYLKLADIILEPSYDIIDALYEPHDGSTVKDLKDYYVVCSGCMDTPSSAVGQSAQFYGSLKGRKELLTRIPANDGISAPLEIYRVIAFGEESQ